MWGREGFIGILAESISHTIKVASPSRDVAVAEGALDGAELTSVIENRSRARPIRTRRPAGGNTVSIQNQTFHLSNIRALFHHLVKGTDFERRVT